MGSLRSSLGENAVVGEWYGRKFIVLVMLYTLELALGALIKPESVT
jgi:hypothetical protein